MLGRRYLIPLKILIVSSLQLLTFIFFLRCLKFRLFTGLSQRLSLFTASVFLPLVLSLHPSVHDCLDLNLVAWYTKPEGDGFLSSDRWGWDLCLPYVNLLLSHPSYLIFFFLFALADVLLHPFILQGPTVHVGQRLDTVHARGPISSILLKEISPSLVIKALNWVNFAGWLTVARPINWI